MRELIHHDTVFRPGTRVLEVACSVGAQTETVAARNPESSLVSFDVAAESLQRAAQRVRAAHLTNVRLLVADLYEGSAQITVEIQHKAGPSLMLYFNSNLGATLDCQHSSPGTARSTLRQGPRSRRGSTYRSKCIDVWLLMTAQTSGRRTLNTLSKTSWTNGATQYCESTSGFMPHSR